MATELEQRAARADQIINDPVYQEAWEACHDRVISYLAEARLSDAPGLQAATAHLQALYAIRDQLQSFMTTGAMAERPRPSVA
jgi:hypothetical protein